MADRALMYQVTNATTTGNAGELQLECQVIFTRDGVVDHFQTVVYPIITDVMNAAQIEATIVASIRALAVQLGYNLQANGIALGAWARN